MAKDSKNRRKKPAVKHNACWTDLKSMHENLAKLIGGTAWTTAKMLKLLPHQEMTPEEITRNNELLTVLTNNLKIAGQAINAVHEQHKDKTGGTGDLGEIAYAAELAGEYDKIQSVYMTEIAPDFHLLQNQLVGLAEEVHSRVQQDVNKGAA